MLILLLLQVVCYKLLHILCHLRNLPLDHNTIFEL